MVINTILYKHLKVISSVFPLPPLLELRVEKSREYRHDLRTAILQKSLPELKAHNDRHRAKFGVTRETLVFILYHKARRRETAKHALKVVGRIP